MEFFSLLPGQASVKMNTILQIFLSGRVVYVIVVTSVQYVEW